VVVMAAVVEVLVKRKRWGHPHDDRSDYCYSY